MSKRKQHATEFEPKVALKGEAPVQALASRCDVYLLPTMHFTCMRGDGDQAMEICASCQLSRSLKRLLRTLPKMTFRRSASVASLLLR
ncbi:hypothetical protein F3W81_17915 [Pseudooceanicola spongiae]|uniref:Uncharacterized protein n=1 Tax=Pseudooceanicola spongiae TaxID=2613965 RepID=A0A7L9WSM9_9RHOB|nr:hypothetical protein F3W81_17915 [Pseudooceanicola spongiae]